MITLADSATVKDVNWNIVAQYIIGISILLAAIFALWDRVRKCFASKVDHDYLRVEVHELRIRVATLEKQDVKLDQIYNLIIEKKRRSHE